MANISITPTILSQWDDRPILNSKSYVWLFSVTAGQKWSTELRLDSEFKGSFISSLGFRLTHSPALVANYHPDDSIDWYLILPTQYHTNPLDLSSFLFSSHSRFVDGTTTFNFYYIGDTNTITVTEYGDQTLNVPVTVQDCIVAVDDSYDSCLPTNFHRCVVTLTADRHYVFSDGVKSVDVCTYQGSQSGFVFTNKFGVFDSFNFIEKSESSRSISYDTVKISSIQNDRVKFVNYNPQDESKTTFITKVLKPNDQSQFSELISSPWVISGTYQVLIDKSSISRSSKAQSYSFSIQGVL